VLWAFLADIHANLEALEACLEDAHARGAQRFALLGDLVGYGADPCAVTERAMQLTSAGAISVKGNHDQAIEGSAAYLNDTARAAIEWTRSQLGSEHRDYLAQLPFTTREEPILFVHASADAPLRWNYVDSAAAAWRSVQASQATYTFCGHVHDQGLYFERPGGGGMGAFRPVPGTAIPVGHNRRWLAIVGSVGQPRDGNPAAAYALFDAAREEITFHRVAYDHFAAADKIERSHLPPGLAYRVRKGI
jgi:diadenosine tetraphosphatase ApaH/serine/threonine PP2A family protein phosphatase